MMVGMTQVKYGWSPKASLGPQMARMTERTQAEALRDTAELMDYQSAYGQEAGQHLSASMVLTVLLPASVPLLFCATPHWQLQPHKAPLPKSLSRPQTSASGPMNALSAIEILEGTQVSLIMPWQRDCRMVHDTQVAVKSCCIWLSTGGDSQSGGHGGSLD